MLNNNPNNQSNVNNSSVVLAAQLSEMSSIEIAEVTGKRHKDVMRSIRKMETAWLNVCGRKFALTSRKVEMPNGGFKDEYYYNLTKEESLYIATKFNDEARAKLVRRWTNLETGKEKPYCQTYQIPQSFSEALMLAAKQAEQIESQQKQIQAQSNQIAELEKQTEYTRVILQSKSTALVTQIAQDYGMSARKFNAILRDLNIQHKVRNQWVLFGKYLNKGYVQSSTFNFTRSDGREDVSMTTEWTQKGRMFLYDTLKANNILPLIEQ